jgi:hypothetical protein
VLADKLVSTCAENVAKNERDEQGVIELARHRNEVGHEVERERQVADERREQELPPSRDARITHQPRDENDAVRNEGRSCARILAPARYDERHDERQPHKYDKCESDQQPEPPGHTHSLAIGTLNALTLRA